MAQGQEARDCTREDFDPPVVLGADLFASPDDDDDDDDGGGLLTAGEVLADEASRQPTTFRFADETLAVRELGYSATNASFVWPNGGRLAALLSAASWSVPPRVLELGSGTGILSIYLRRKGLGVVVSSDYDDGESGDHPTIEENIAHNCRLNGVAHHHVAHTWGHPFPFDVLRNHFAAAGDARGDVDVVVASDILLYAEQYDSLVASLLQLFRHSHETKLAISTDRSSGSRGSDGRGSVVVEGKECGYPVLLLNVARRLKTTPLFFEKLEQAGFVIHHLRDKGSNVAITHKQYHART